MKGVNDPRYDETMTGQPLSKEEVKRICDLWDTGIYGVYAIHKKTGHGTHVIRKYLKKAGRYPDETLGVDI